MRSIISCLFFLSIFISPVYSQDKRGKLIGNVKDHTLKAITYATVNLLKAGRAEAVKRTFTNSKGTFELIADTGKYILSISHVGIPENNINVQIKNGDNILDDIILTTVPNLLQNISITVTKPLIEQGDDKLTYNVESDPAAKSESASDVLRKTPMVTVDGEGNVQLNGQSNFKILLNGRETSMFAQNVKDALKNFPASVISKIEVITSPSAKYDAEGVGGIINIITKKKVIGYNGYVSSYYSTLNNYSESLSLNLKTGRFGMSGYIGTSGSTKNIRSQSLNETTPYVNAAFSKRNLQGERFGRNIGTYGNLEITYDVDSFKTIALYGNLGGYRNSSNVNQIINTEYSFQSPEIAYFFQNNSAKNPNAGIGTDFIRRFRNKPDKELTFRFNGQFSKNNLFNNSLQDYPQQDRYVINESISKNKEYTYQVDFTQPLKGKQKLELGTKAILRSASSDFTSLIKYNNTDNYKLNPSNSNRFNYHQEIYSIYGSYNFPFKKLSFRTGLRGEFTNVRGDFQSSNTVVNQQYFNLIPNIVTSRKFTSVYTLTGSYNMRLQRPYTTNLNPFINNNDSLNISYGNPALGPQILHAVAIQNRFVKGKFFAGINLNGSYTNNMIVQYVSFNQSTGVTSITSANFGREYQSSLGFNLNTPLTEKLNAGIGTQLRYNHIENKSNLLQKQEGISGGAYINFNYKAIGKFTISGSGGIQRSPYALVNTLSTQGFYQVNFGYKFFKEKLSVTMNVNNFHKKYMQFNSVTDDPNFRIVSANINPYRVIYFGATYNFGKLKENISKKKGVTNDDLVQ